MKKFPKILSVLALAFSAMSSAQGTIAAAYPQLYTGSAAAALTGNAAEVAKSRIDAGISAMVSDPVLRNAQWGFVIYDPKTRQIVNGYKEAVPFTPASTTKLLTTDTAFSLLGSKFHWVTQLEYSGTLDSDGTLNGNLYLVGSGDPTMNTGKAGASSYADIANDFASAVSGKGIKRINGNIYVQTAVFKENKNEVLPENIVWLEQNNYYLPVGSTKEINPANEKLTIKQANPFSNEKRYFYVSPYAKRMVFAEKFDGGTITTKIPDAPSSLANILKSHLAKSGIPVSGSIIPKMTDPDPEKRNFIFSYNSPTLAETIFYTNQHSDNALAEATLRMVGFQKLGDQSLASGRAVVLDHLEKVAFDMNGFNYIDGSGLSHSNSVTPIAQAKFLASRMNEKYFKEYFDSLPVAGQSGTLKKMFFGSSYGQIFAKTGTLNKVKCLAGYIKTRTGRTLTFSMLVNNYAGSVDGVKSRMEQLLDPAMDL